MKSFLVNLFHATGGKIIATITGGFTCFKLRRLRTGDYFVDKNTKYVSQIAGASMSLIEKPGGFINDRMASKRFGAKNLKEFSYWGWRACGICCIQMAISTYQKNFNKKIMDLIKECLVLGGYNTKTDRGWYHSSLSKLAMKYGLKSGLKKFVSSYEVANILLDKKFVIASITIDSNYRNKTEDGHLILLYGFKIINGSLAGFWCHDPGVFTNRSRASFIDRNDFDKCFTRRIITICQ